MLSSTTGLACPRTTRREWHGPPSMFVNYLTIPNRLARLGLGYMIRALQRKLYRKAKEGIRRANDARGQ
jgi:hypothetical protein